jgi:hypothetical protein
MAEVQADDADQATRIDLSAVEVQARRRHFELPPIQQPMRVDLTNDVVFLGFEADVLTFHPGDAVNLSLYWQANGVIKTSYVAFVHVVDGEEHIVAQQDQIPQQGQAPTTGWLPGEIIADVKTVFLPPEMRVGVYQIYVGMYDPRTGRRLRLADQSGDVISLGRIVVQ